jgi:excisionase family DNA binding protein
MTRLLTIPEVSERLGISRPTVRHLIDKGHLRAISIPGLSETRRTRRIHPDVLEEFIAENASAPTKKADAK